MGQVFARGFNDVSFWLRDWQSSCIGFQSATTGWLCLIVWKRRKEKWIASAPNILIVGLTRIHDMKLWILKPFRKGCERASPISNANEQTIYLVSARRVFLGAGGGSSHKVLRLLWEDGKKEYFFLGCFWSSYRPRLIINAPELPSLMQVVWS